MEELWDYVPRFKNMVQVSTLGRIKSVHQYKLNGEFIKTYKSCYDCSIELNTTNATVSRHCYSGKPLKGYIVKY